MQFDRDFLSKTLMGPNAVRLLEELMQDISITRGMRVMDLGCGMGLTSMCLAESGATVFAVDLWIPATENYKRFCEHMPGSDIIPIHADATDLPFADEYFDAVISVDAYHYIGCDAAYMDEKLAPLVKKDGIIAICVPGLKEELCGNIPDEMKKSWTADDLSTFHSCAWWRELMQKSRLIEIIDVKPLNCCEASWRDWLETDNPYAMNDRKAMEAGAGEYMNFISILLKCK